MLQRVNTNASQFLNRMIHVNNKEKKHFIKNVTDTFVFHEGRDLYDK